MYRAAPALALLLFLVACDSGDNAGDGGGPDATGDGSPDATGDGSPDGSDGGGDALTPGPLTPTIEAAAQVGALFDVICEEERWPEAAAELEQAALAISEVEAVYLGEEDYDPSVLYTSGALQVLSCDEGDLLADSGEGDWKDGIPSKNEAAVVVFGDKKGMKAEVQGPVGNIAKAVEDACGYILPEGAEAPTLEWFADWSRRGAIYLNGHGGKTKVPQRTGKTVFYIVTASPNAVVNGPEYEEHVEQNRILLGKKGAGVTGAYFREMYGSRPLPGSIIYLDTCHSLAAVPENDIPAALLAVGADMVLGWTHKMHRELGAATASYFFDRGCGLSVVDADALDPPTRPFPLIDVYNKLVARGETTFRVSRDVTSELVYKRGGGDAAQSALRPVLADGYFLPPTPPLTPRGTLFLTGFFGTTEGEVLIGDGMASQEPAEIVTWEPNNIVAYVADEGDMDVGNVQVKVGRLYSNPMRLTKFTASAIWTPVDGSRYEGAVAGDFVGRILLQRMREEIDGPAKTSVNHFGSATLIAESGTISWDVSGEWDEGNNHHSVVARGAAEIDGNYPTPIGNEGGAFLQIDFDLDAETYALVLVTSITGTDTVTTRTGTEEHSFREGPGSNNPIGPRDLPTDWTIPADTFVFDDMDPDVRFEVSWDNIAPDFMDPDIHG